MPVTKSAKRALRGSHNKFKINQKILASLEKATRSARKTKTTEKIKKAISLADRAAKKGTIHQNKASRIKKRLSFLLPKTEKKTQVKKKNS